MSLARGKYEEPPKPTVRAKTVEVVNKLGRVISKTARSGPLDFIAVFCFTITAVGELIGSSYGMSWYIILSILLILLFLKETNLFNKEEHGKHQRQNLSESDRNIRDNGEARS